LNIFNYEIVNVNYLDNIPIYTSSLHQKFLRIPKEVKYQQQYEILKIFLKVPHTKYVQLSQYLEQKEDQLFYINEVSVN
jgi:hypothetical protein